jgi:hypothetical protein
VSYCRFGPESHLYVYLDVGGYFCCCACPFLEDLASAQLYTTDELLEHLRLHEEAGHRGPYDRVRKHLEEEREENDAWIAGEAS